MHIPRLERHLEHTGLPHSIQLYIFPDRPHILHTPITSIIKSGIDLKIKMLEMEHNIPLSSRIQAPLFLSFLHFSAIQAVFDGFLISSYSFISMASLRMTVSDRFDTL